MAATDPRSNDVIRPVGYRAGRGHQLGVEVLSAEELGRRVRAVPDRGIERVDLWCLLYVRRGEYRHMVDFDTYRCGAGSVITVKPGQVHEFGLTSGWDGWFIVLRSEHTGRSGASPMGQIADPLTLPVEMHLDAEAAPVLEAVIRRMAADSERDAPSDALDALLLYQLHELTIRLRLVGDAPGGRAVESVVLQRFREFRAEVEHRYTVWHGVAPYARHLGVSARSLTRATETVVGLTAKAYITDRIVLEAKRLLAHTAHPVATVARMLGFDEPTNFVKYFRRETGLTPGAFRAASRPAAAS